MNPAKFAKIALATLAIAATGFTARSAPLDLNSPGVVGVWDYLQSNANETTRLTSAQTLLTMTAGTGVFGTDEFVTSATEYSGTLTSSALGIVTDFGSLASISGYDYGFAKYDGPNAGYVLFYLGGALASSMIPQYPANLWTSNPQQYAISGVTFYNESSTNVPDGGATAVLLGLGLVAMSFVARRKIQA